MRENDEGIKQVATLPPLVTFINGDDFWLADGCHRYHEHRAIEADEIPGYVHEETKRDAILYSVGANHGHGLRCSNEDKRKSVMTLLADAEWAAWSDREIARRCGVSHPLLAAGKPRVERGAKKSS